MDARDIILILAGMGLLAAGAELLVRGASRLAAAAGISPLIIGLTVVAYGTSSPELVVSTLAAVSGQADIAIGNVVGSNIFNVLFILGVSAMASPLVVARQVVRIDVPVMAATSVLVLLLGLDGTIGRSEGLLLLGGLAVYTGFQVRQAGRKRARDRAEQTGRPGGKRTGAGHAALDLVMIAGGLGLLVLGSRWLVAAAVVMARALGVSELAIGLTIVAAGTSLPEAATSIVASVRGERDIAVGNIVGSNIFNVLMVLGVTGLVSPEGVPVSSAALGFDIPVMIAVSLACLPVFLGSHRISRPMGAVFVAYFCAYVVFLLADASGHAAFPVVKAAMTWFFLPGAVVAVAVMSSRAARGRFRRPPDS